MPTSSGDDYSHIPFRLTEATDGPMIDLEPLFTLLALRVDRRTRRTRLKLHTASDQEQPPPPPPVTATPSTPRSHKPRKRSPKQ